MPISFDDPEVDLLAKKIAEATGESVHDAVLNALRERLKREGDRRAEIARMVEDAMAIGRHCASLPVYDTRSADEILGYDEFGLPT